MLYNQNYDVTSVQFVFDVSGLFIFVVTLCNYIALVSGQSKKKKKKAFLAPCLGLDLD